MEVDQPEMEKIITDLTVEERLRLLLPYEDDLELAKFSRKIISISFAVRREFGWEGDREEYQLIENHWTVLAHTKCDDKELIFGFGFKFNTIVEATAFAMQYLLTDFKMKTYRNFTLDHERRIVRFREILEPEENDEIFFKGPFFTFDDQILTSGRKDGCFLGYVIDKK